MKCLLSIRELPKKCPKCGKRLKSEKCTCGHTVCQEPDNHEKGLYDARYDYVRMLLHVPVTGVIDEYGKEK